MTDSKYVKNTFKRGISSAELYGEGNRHGGGVPIHRGVEENYVGGLGMPMPGDGPISEPPQATDCSGITVKGKACKAHPVRGEKFCVGHLRSANGS